MSEMKPFASLGPLLLARKGTAKPAMRVQLDAGSRGTLDDVEEIAASQEELGWNDMGDADDAIAAITPEEPAVRRQMTDLVHRIADANLAAFQAAENHNRASAADSGRRAAFTLRLDEERHLRLRLASTVHGESAQALVTRALDSLLSQMPEIEQLAAQVRPTGARGKNKA